MTDTSTQPVETPGLALPPDQLASSLQATLTSAPELAKSPGLAVGVASSGNTPALAAQSVAHATNTISAANAHATVDQSAGGDLSHALDWFGNHVVEGAAAVGHDVVHAAGQAGSAVLNVMNKPLAQVQHEYRYLHDVAATHGAGAALLEGLAIAGAGVAGTVATGGNIYAGELAGEATAGVLSQIAYRDSWERTGQASYADPHTKQQVSLGRDVASLLGLASGSTAYKVSSGVIDGLFDLNAGGTEALGLARGARSAEGLGGVLASRWGGTAPRTIGEAVGGEGVIEPGEMERITAQYQGIRRAFADIASKNVDQLRQTPAYAPFEPIFDKLGAADTVERVGQVFKGVLRTQELAYTDRLPSLSWTRAHFGQALRDQVESMKPTEVDPNGIHPIQRAASLVNPANMAQRLSAVPTWWDDATKSISTKVFDPSSATDDGTRAVYRTLRYTEDAPTAAAVASAYHNTPDLGDKVLAYRNIVLNILLAKGGLRQYTAASFQDAPDIERYLTENFQNPGDRQKMKEGIDNAIGGGMFGKEAWYGVDDEGHNLSRIKNKNGDAEYGAAIWKNQTGKLAMLDLAGATRAGKQLAGARDLFGGIDSFAYEHITQGIFKPLVLLTPSYAMHISMAEMIPNILREGGFKLAKSAVAQNYAHLGYRIGEEEAGKAASKSILDKLTRAQHAGASKAELTTLTRQYEAVVGETQAKHVSAVLVNAYHLVTAGMSQAPTRMTADLEDRMRVASIYTEAIGGDKVVSGAGSSHAYEAEYAPDKEDQAVNLFRKGYMNSPMKSSKNFGLIGNGHDQFIPAWQSSIREIANDETGQFAAKSLIDAGRTHSIYRFDGGRTVDPTDTNGAYFHIGDDSSASPYAPGGPFDTGRSGTANQRMVAAPRNPLEMGRSPQHGSAGSQALAWLNPEESGRLSHLSPREIRTELESRGIHGSDDLQVLREVKGAEAARAAGHDAIIVHQNGIGIHDQSKNVVHIPDEYVALHPSALEPPRTLAQASEVARENLARHLRSLNETDPEEVNWAIRKNPDLTANLQGFEKPAEWDNYDEWAHVKVQALRGVVRGTDKSVSGELLRQIAEGKTPDRFTLKGMPEGSWPTVVKNREMVPDGTGTIQKIANKGFSKVLNPMVDFLSRQPIAFNEFYRQWKIQEPLVDAGLKDYDEAINLALTTAVNRVLRNVHNLTDRTQWTVTLRNWAPFFFAQEQAYRRMGRLLAEDPLAFRRYQLMISNIADVGQVFGGQNGQGYFVLPGTGFMTAGVARAASAIGLPVEGSSPIGMGWNLSSTGVIFPLSSGVRPDIGPLVAVPTEAIATLFPETLSPVLKSDLTSGAATILGPAATQPIYDQMVPNVIVQRLLTAAFPQFDSRSFNSTMMQTLATLEFEGKVPPPGASAWQMQTFLDRVRNQTRIMYATKAIAGAVTPVSPEVTNQTYNNMNATLTADITKTGSVSKGIQEFIGKNPDATPFTVFQSSNQQGVSIPASVQAENLINENLPLIRQYPSAALLLLMSQPKLDTAYSANVYQEQLAQGLRTKWFPGGETPNGELEGYLAQVYVAAGNSVVLGKWYPQYESQLAGLTGSAKYAAEQAWQTTLTKYAQQNPVWGTWWNSDDKSTQRGEAVTQMKTLLASPDAPPGPIADDTRTLLQSYANYESELNIGSSDGFIGQSQSSINQDWKDYLYQTVAENPELTTVVTGLFMSIPTASTAPNGSPTSATPGQFSTTNWKSA